MNSFFIVLRDIIKRAKHAIAQKFSSTSRGEAMHVKNVFLVMLKINFWMFVKFKVLIRSLGYFSRLVMQVPFFNFPTFCQILEVHDKNCQFCHLQGCFQPWSLLIRSAFGQRLNSFIVDQESSVFKK